MKIHSRRIFVWLISFFVVIVVYKLYTVFNRTPDVDLNEATTFTRESSGVDGNSLEHMGRIGDVEVEHITDAVFYDKNPDTGEIEREFGYKIVTNVEGSEWDIQKPYMILFRPDLTLKITAERGRVIIEDAAGRVSPSDATLTGNVIVHIDPNTNSDAAESFLYLNNIVFISEQSKMTSSGPVRFVSGNARLNGRGLELVYNEELNRLEFLRILHLESLRVRSSQTSLLSSKSEQANQESTTYTSFDGGTDTGVSGNSLVSDDMYTGSVAAMSEEENFYQCILNKNVEVQVPGQLITADKIAIHNIMNAADSDTPIQTQQQSPSKDEESIRRITGASGQQDSDEETIEVIVTCDEGIVVVPSDYVSIQELSERTELFVDDFVKEKSENLVQSGQITTYVATTIDYLAESGDVLSRGPSEITFYIEDFFNTGTSMPVNVRAEEKVTFYRSANKVVFEGNCRCSMRQGAEDVEERFTLTAPRIIVNLFPNEEKRFDRPSEIQKIIADKGTVRLSTTKKRGDELLGGIELKCERFDYFAQEEYLVAMGPGVIKADNSNAEEQGSNLNRYSLRRRCYAPRGIYPRAYGYCRGVSLRYSGRTS